jgi:hypothetical protein
MVDGNIVAGIAYPLLLWIGRTVYVAVTRSPALATLVAVGPLVILVVAALLWDENRRPGGIRDAARPAPAVHGTGRAGRSGAGERGRARTARRRGATTVGNGRSPSGCRGHGGAAAGRVSARRM